MDKIALVAVSLSVISVAAGSQPLLAQEAANSEAPFTLTITGNLMPEHSQYWDFANNAETRRTPRDGVVIAVQKTNVSSHEIPKISKWGNYYFGCEYDIRDSGGLPVKEMPPRTSGSSFAGRFQGQKEPVLQPGESYVDAERLDERYDLSQPGTYTIQAWAHAWDDPQSPIVKSNILTLVVEPAKAAVPKAPADSEEAPAAIPDSAKPAPTFALHIEEDPTAAQIAPGYHRVVVSYTRILPGFELDQFHPESENMYNVIVTRDGVPVPELPALRALRDYRKVDRFPTIASPRLLKEGESWTTVLAVSDFFDMTAPGVYQVTVTRPSQPLNLAYSAPVRSNTLSMVVPPGAAAPVVPDAKKPKPQFELTVGPEPPDAQNSAVLRVEIDNTSKRTLREYKCESFLGMYDLSVSWNGVPIESTDQMKQLQAARARVDCAGNVVLTTIEPGEFSADDIPVGAFFDISRPGTYAVVVSRETYPWEPEKSVRVESNSYSFEVREVASGGAER